MPEIVYDQFRKNSAKIKKLVVGIHFYQTHPDFLQQFVGNRKVKIVLQPSGTFHPKLFLFFNSENDWCLLVGSANFTEPAFSSNTEAVTLIQGNKTHIDILEQAKELVNRNWEAGNIITDEMLRKYKEKWKLRKKQRSELNEPFGFNTYFDASDIMLKNWHEYVLEYSGHSLDHRFGMLDLAKSIFKEKVSFDNMTNAERAFIGGIADKMKVPYSNRFADFGTNGNGYFRRIIDKGSKHFSKALDEIPFNGLVSENDYHAFIRLFLKEPQVTVGWVGGATRLLAMKRPDTFYCLTNANRTKFSEKFNVVPSRVTLDNYWELIINRIQKCTWWNAEKPNNLFESKLWLARAAMLDVIYYTD